MALEPLFLPCTVSSDKLRVSKASRTVGLEVFSGSGAIQGSAYISPDDARKLAMWLFAYVHTAGLEK